MSDSVRPHRWKPTRLPCPWDSPGKNIGVVAISFSSAWKWKVKVKSLSHVRLLATPWTAVYYVPPSMGFSRQEDWSGVPLPSLQWTWLWANSRRQRRIGKAGMLQSQGCKEWDTTYWLNNNKKKLEARFLISSKPASLTTSWNFLYGVEDHSKQADKALLKRTQVA